MDQPLFGKVSNQSFAIRQVGNDKRQGLGQRVARAGHNMRCDPPDRRRPRIGNQRVGFGLA